MTVVPGRLGFAVEARLSPTTALGTVCSPQAATSVVSPVITINRCRIMDYEQGNCWATARRRVKGISSPPQVRDVANGEILDNRVGAQGMDQSPTIHARTYAGQL